MALSQDKWCSVVTRLQRCLEFFFSKMVGAVSVWPELTLRTKSLSEEAKDRNYKALCLIFTLQRSAAAFWGAFSEHTSSLERQRSYKRLSKS